MTSDFNRGFLLFLGVVCKNKWHHWIPEEKLVQMPALPPVPVRRYRLHASIHGRHPLSPEAKLVMHCGSQRMPRPARDRALQRLGGINGSPVPELAPLGTWKSDVLVAN